MRPICVPCGTEMKVEKNDEILEMRTRSDRRYYQTVHADRWKCPSCDHEIYSSYGRPYRDESTTYDRLILV